MDNSVRLDTEKQQQAKEYSRIMPLFNKYVPLDEEHAALAKRLVKLAEQAGTKIQGVYKFDLSKRTNAAH